MLEHFKKVQNKIIPSLSTFALINASVFTGIVGAQSQATVEEIVVTARKRSESLQDVPLSVSAIKEEDLEERGINVFEDYLLDLPGVTAGGSGPGQSTIYIRGLASTTPNLTTAGVAGLAPNVSFYLDEQPLAQPGRNLDVYAADIARIEVLSGPQGTLFGSGSQSGVVRMITNKPQIGESASNFEIETRFMPDGSQGNKFEAVTNIPVGDSTAVRFVAYRDERGGYIDQVAGTVNTSQSARWRPGGTMRANGVPVGSSRAGFRVGADLSAVNFVNANAIEKEDVNSSEYVGYRSSLMHEINDNWSALVSYSSQTIDSDGVFYADPTLGDLEIQTYTDNSISDEYDNMSITLEGTIGDLEVIYAGAYTDRDTQQDVDYTDYLFVGQYLPYYVCDYTVYQASSSTAAGAGSTCYAPNLLVRSSTKTEVETHELRVNTAINDTTSATFGVFSGSTELQELNLFTYPGSLNIAAYNWADNYPLTDVSVSGNLRNAGAGWFSGGGPYTAPVIFFNDILRTDEQFGVFGEVTFEMSDTMDITLGARYYESEVDFEGSANSSFFNSGGTDGQAYGANLSTQFAPGNPDGNPDKAESDGTIIKATAKWTPDEDTMYYVTYSEGYRPGLLNRPVGSSNADGSYVVPASIDSDTVDNYEFGWKTVKMDGRLRFNGSVFFVEVAGLQSTIFDPSIVNLFFSDNAADAEITGIEGDFEYYPLRDGLSIRGAFSSLDSEVTAKLVPTNDVVVGQELAFAPGFQANINIRQEFPMDGGMMGHVVAQMNTTDDSFGDIMQMNRAQIEGYTAFDMRAGFSNDEMTAEMYIENITDERGEINNNFVFDRERVTYIRPLTIGIRYKKSF